MRASICMATFNGSAYVREQVDSILAQLLPGDELLVSDDASTDATPALLAGYGAALQIVGLDRAGGVVPNFERVLRCATGDFVVLADQDDVWLPGKLARLRSELSGADLVMSNAWVVDAQLRRTNDTVFDQVLAAPGAFRNWGGRSSFVGCCMAFRRDLLGRALPFPPMTPWHDWLLGLLASLTARVSFVDEPLMLYRRHSANASETGAGSRNGAWAKVLIRLRVAVAVGICMVRRCPRPKPVVRLP